MSGQNVGKQTDCQCERFGNGGNQFDDWHQREGFQEHWHIGPKNVFPIVLVAEHVDAEIGHQGKDNRNGKVTRYIGAEWEERNQDGVLFFS